MAARIVNLLQWRGLIFERLRQQIATTADPALVALLEEVQAYPIPPEASATPMQGEHLGVVSPLQLRSPAGVLSFICTLTVFGSPNDITLQELAVGSFFPADEVTTSTLRQLAG